MLVGTNRFCPNCKTVLGITLALPYLEPIGEPFITCPYCGQKFRSGKNYWCDMTPEEKAKAKAVMIKVSILIFFLFSAIIYSVGLIAFGGRLPYWLAGLIAVPIAYFAGTWNFNRLKRFKPPSGKYTQNGQKG